jgi:excisionase family DNA binding protein
METKRESRLLTVTEVAERLRLKEGTIRDWILKRQIPYLKIGKSIRIKPEVVERMIQEAEIPARK